MSDDLLSKGKLDPAKLAEIFKDVQLPDSSLFGSGLDKISFGLGSRNDGPDYYRQSEYSADPRKVALREAKEKEATVALGNQPVSIPVIIPKNPSGNTDYTYIVGKLHEAGLDVSAPLMKRVFDPQQITQMRYQGTDRSNGMSLTTHHGGDDGEWLAMIEHGVRTHETGRTTYVSNFTERDLYDLVRGPFGAALAIYDARGLMSCQPSHNKTNSFSNGHHLFVCNPKSALLAIIL